MTNIRKYIFALLLSGSVVLLFPACGGGGGGGGSSGESDNDASSGNASTENGFAPASVAGKTAILYDSSAYVQRQEIKFGTDNTCSVYWPNWGGGTTLTGTYTYNKLSANAAEIYISAKVDYPPRGYRKITDNLHLIFEDQKSASGTRRYTEKVASEYSGTITTDTSGTHNIYFYL